MISVIPRVQSNHVSAILTIAKDGRIRENSYSHAFEGYETSLFFCCTAKLIDHKKGPQKRPLMNATVCLQRSHCFADLLLAHYLAYGVDCHHTKTYFIKQVGNVVDQFTADTYIG